MSASPHAASQVLKCTCKLIHKSGNMQVQCLALCHRSSGEFPLSPCHTCFDLFKLPTRETLQKGRGHSTWLESRFAYYVATIIVLTNYKGNLVYQLRILSNNVLHENFGTHAY